MAKDPSFPFLAQDYLVDTFQWTNDQKALHVDMLAISWINGEIVADKNGNPVNFTKTQIRTFQLIKHKWTLTEGKLINKKLEEARAGRNSFRQLQSERGKKSAESKKKVNHGSTMVQPECLVQPLENEHEYEKELEVNIWKESFEILKLDQIFWETEILMRFKLDWSEIDRALEKFWLSEQKKNTGTAPLKVLRAGFKSYLLSWESNKKSAIEKTHMGKMEGTISIADSLIKQYQNHG